MKIQLGMWEMQYSIIHLNLGFMPKQTASNAPDDHSPKSRISPEGSLQTSDSKNWRKRTGPRGLGPWRSFLSEVNGAEQDKGLVHKFPLQRNYCFEVETKKNRYFNRLDKSLWCFTGGKELRRVFSDNVLGRAVNYRASYSGFTERWSLVGGWCYWCAS